MNKTELVSTIAEKAGIEQKSALSAFEALTSTISTTLAGGDSIVIPGFGTFSVKDRAARTGRNPKTGAPLEIAASRAPHFKVGSKLKEQVATD